MSDTMKSEPVERSGNYEDLAHLRLKSALGTEKQMLEQIRGSKNVLGNSREEIMAEARLLKGRRMNVTGEVHRNLDQGGNVTHDSGELGTLKDVDITAEHILVDNDESEATEIYAQTTLDGQEVIVKIDEINDLYPEE